MYTTTISAKVACPYRKTVTNGIYTRPFYEVYHNDAWHRYTSLAKASAAIDKESSIWRVVRQRDIDRMNKEKR